MEMLMADNNLDEEYEEWFLKKEAYNKLFNQIWNEYLRVFGKLLILQYQWESACKYMQKKVFYKSKYPKEIMEKIIRTEMEDDLEDWNELNKEVESARYAYNVTPVQLYEIDQMYYSIFKIIKPEFIVKENIQSIWKKSQNAYICNDEVTLKEILNELKNYKGIENSYNNKELIKRIKSLKQEVQEMKNSEMFEYKKILEDPQLILKKEKQIVEVN